MEDDPLLRMLAVEVVEEAGCIAIEVRDADEAVILLESRTDIALLFTDINMPGEPTRPQISKQFGGHQVHLPIIEQCRHLFRKISMLHEPSGVCVAFHAMIFNQLYAVLGSFAELVLRVRRHGDNGAL